MHESFRLESQDVTYVTPNKRQLLNGLNLALDVQDKVCLIGRNGVGKSTLARLLAGELQPSAGNIIAHGCIGYVPQRLIEHESTKTIADLLGVSKKLDALERAENGTLTEGDAALLAGSWDTVERIRRLLGEFGLEHISLRRSLHQLSGGELRRLHIARLESSDFLILDEPTNDLDRDARQFLRNWLQRRKKGWLVISHDRDLLEIAQSIADLTEQGLRTYSGNYRDFLEARTQNELALAASITEQQKSLRKQEAICEIAKRRQHRRTQKASADTKDKGIDRKVIQVLKERAESTLARLCATHENRIEEQRNALAKARGRLRLENRIRIDLPQAKIDEDELVAEFESVSFGFSQEENGTGTKVLFKDLTLTLRGPERLAVVGANGSGKTTFLRLLSGELEPTHGAVRRGKMRLAYLAQQSDGLNNSLTLIETLHERLGTQDESEVFAVLEAHNFVRSLAERPIETLSGAERLRAALLATLSMRDAPQLLLLDEPTNNLDLPAVEELEVALCAFEGALVVVSHEETFLKNIGVTSYLSTF